VQAVGGSPGAMLENLNPPLTSDEPCILLFPCFEEGRWRTGLVSRAGLLEPPDYEPPISYRNQLEAERVGLAKWRKAVGTIEGAPLVVITDTTGELVEPLRPVRAEALAGPPPLGSTRQERQALRRWHELKPLLERAQALGVAPEATLGSGASGEDSTKS
jgi:hypothetical protein